MFFKLQKHSPVEIMTGWCKSNVIWKPTRVEFDDLSILNLRMCEALKSYSSATKFHSVSQLAVNIEPVIWEGGGS